MPIRSDATTNYSNDCTRVLNPVSVVTILNATISGIQHDLHHYAWGAGICRAFKVVGTNRLGIDTIHIRKTLGIIIFSALTGAVTIPIQQTKFFGCIREYCVGLVVVVGE